MGSQNQLAGRNFLDLRPRNTIAIDANGDRRGKHGKSDRGPQKGDVVVGRDSRRSIRFTVHQVPGVTQLSASSREAALRLARGFARIHAVDVWYRGDDGFRLLEVYRPRTDVDTASRARHALPAVTLVKKKDRRGTV